MKLTLSVKEASVFLNMSEQQLRIGLQRGALPVGTAIGKPSKTRKNFTVYHYHIPKLKIEEYMGITYEEFLKNKESRN